MSSKKTMPSDRDILQQAKEAMLAESAAIVAAQGRLGATFLAAVKMLDGIRGKVVVTGLGKSGHIARKLAATFASTGTPSFFLHPSEALHGDLGMLSRDDALLAIAFGGETTEVIEVARHARRAGSPVIAITGKTESSLASLSDHVLDGSISREVCPLNLAPTASTSVALALGDALAICLMQVRGFTAVDFAALHPGGSLGRRLASVVDLMRPVNVELPTVGESTGFHDVLKAVTSKNFGIVPVVDENGRLVGAISDGDIRRCLLKDGAAALGRVAREIMTARPRTIPETKLALDAFQTMETNQITSLFVVDATSPLALRGIVRMHDLLAAKIV